MSEQAKEEAIMATLLKEQEDMMKEFAPKTSSPTKVEEVHGEGNFQVTLAHAPTLRVRADDEAQAWEAYKAKSGVIKADHAPVITRLV